MIPVESPHGPGVVGISGGELARYHAFTACWASLYVPEGTRPMLVAGYDTAYNSNDVLRAALEQCVTCLHKHQDGGCAECACPTFVAAQWVNVWDDDHAFQPDTLIRLLDRNVDVCMPLYTQRQPPFHPCIYKAQHEDGSCDIFTWEDLEGKSGLLPIASAGKGGILIRRHVIEKLPDPWFERLGKIGEDHLFFKKCREAGFGVYADLDCGIGHLTPMEVRPHRDAQGRWCGQVDLKRGVTVELWSATYQSTLEAAAPTLIAAGG